MEEQSYEKASCEALAHSLSGVYAVMASCNDKNALRGHGAFWESKEGWFGTFLELPYGIPSHGTLGRIFTASDPKKFLEAFMRGEIPPCLIGRRWKRARPAQNPALLAKDCIDWFAEKGAWESLRSVGVVAAVREIDGKISVERRYHLIPRRHSNG